MPYPLLANQKNRYPRYYLIRKFKRQISGEKSCALCGSECVEAHHKDFRRDNHDPSNLILVCRKCHMHCFHKGRPHPNYKRGVGSNTTVSESSANEEREPSIGLHEVAMIICVSDAWVYRQVKAGRIPNHRFQGMIRFHRKDIDELMDAHKTGRAGEEEQPTSK